MEQIMNIINIMAKVNHGIFTGAFHFSINLSPEVVHNNIICSYDFWN